MAPRRLVRVGGPLAGGIVAAVLAGCAPAVPAPAPPPPPGPTVTAEPTATPSAEPPPQSTTAPPPAAAAPPEPPFPPAAFPAPAARTARPGDGLWFPLLPAGAALEAGAPALLYRSEIHPDPRKPQVHVALVAVDLRRVALNLVAGTLEPRSATVPEDHRPGLVPAADLPDLLAVLNGGFMTRHGTWGMAIGGDVFLPPHDDGCTVALLGDGSVRIRTQRDLKGELGAAPAALLAFRQTPPCLVEKGEVLADLLGPDKPRRWGLSETGGVDIRRSALGLAEGGRTLIYGLGEWIGPRALAEAMRAAGAVDAAELDVNWSFTRFLLYGPGPGGSSAPPEVTATLIPKLKHAAGQYVTKPAERDFFYLKRRR
jgi:hypothetical protein